MTELLEGLPLAAASEEREILPFVSAPRRTTRHWPNEKKRRIVEETMKPGMSVSMVSRRYDVNANQIFKWTKQFEKQKGGKNVVPHDFIPVTITTALAKGEKNPAHGPIAIKLGGITVRVERNFDEETLRRVIAVMKTPL